MRERGADPSDRPRQSRRRRRNRRVRGRDAGADDGGAAVLLSPVLLKADRSKFSSPLPAASTTVMPWAVTATMAEKISGQNCIATYLLFGPPGACSSIRMTSPFLSWEAALISACARLKTPPITAE
jgi:hypothetical protein